MTPPDPSTRRDRFGNAIDATVGYARGAMLPDSLSESRRAAHAEELIRARLESHGVEGVYDFTGSPGGIALCARDRDLVRLEAVLLASCATRLRECALAHLGFDAGDAILCNRTSAAIVAAVATFSAPGDTLISVTPGVPSHPSIPRAARLAGVQFQEVHAAATLESQLEASRGQLVVVTTVSSELANMDESEYRAVIEAVRRAGRLVLVDDAYGARVRPVLLGGASAGQAGADLAVTSMQKAGMEGPRAGLLAGDAARVGVIRTRARELGLEARGIVALGALRALEHYDPDSVRGEVRAGEALYRALVSVFGRGAVESSLLGPVVAPEEILLAIHRRAALNAQLAEMVPAEAAALLGMVLLARHGLLTVNAIGMPGARVSLRLKTSETELRRVGGEPSLVRSLEDSLEHLVREAADPAALRRRMFGEN